MAVFIPKSFIARPWASQQFSQIVAWASKHHPFYQQWIVNPEIDVPILTRTNILENNKLLLNDHPVVAKTSGSTGVPVEIAQSAERRQQDNKDTAMFVGWLGGKLPRSRIVYAPNDTSADLLDVQSPIAEQLKFIRQRYQQFAAVAITTYPTNAVMLSEAILKQGLDFTFIQRFGCFAEVFEPQQEALIHRAFPNAKIWSTYSAMEFGMIAARCPHEPDFHHIMGHKLGIEVLDENNDPCQEGTVGRLVITDYMNKFMPFIRYDIGDLAASANCPCGRINRLALSQLSGKVRGALKHRNGQRMLFSGLSVSLRDIQGMMQYQVIQEALERFVVTVVVSEQTDLSRFKLNIEQAFEQHFSYFPKIEIVYAKHIPKGSNGKYYASICKV